MSKVSSTPIKLSRTPSKEGITDGAQDQRVHSDEQPFPENDIVGPTENLNTHQPSASANVGLATGVQEVVVQKGQPSLSELMNVMKQVLDVLQNSTIASKGGKDNRSRFWGVYKQVAEEHDGEFLERYTGDMDIVLVFSGLFSAVSTSFIIAMESNLSPDPSDTTNALLTQLVQIGLGNLTAAGSAAAAPAFMWSPSTTDIWIQTIAYASLSMSLLAAFGAVLGKQWLGYYKSNRYGRGSQEERAKHRQEKFDGIIAWYFDAVVQSFPVLLQISLLLFGIALSANMWHKQHTIAWVVIAMTMFGFLFYSLTVMASVISPACPFQTPVSTMFYMLRIGSRMQTLLGLFWDLLSEVLKELFNTLRSLISRLSSLVLHSSADVVDPEAQALNQGLDENKSLLVLDIPTCHLEAPSIKWLLETSTDPEVTLAAVSLIPHVEWPLDLDVSDMMHQVFDIHRSCFDLQRQTVLPSLEEKASICIMALSHLYCGRVLQEYPNYHHDDIHLIEDYWVFNWIWSRSKGQDQVLATATKLSVPTFARSWIRRSVLDSSACSDSDLQWLSHILPYHFVAGQVDEDVEKLATAVISKLLFSPSPSPQIIANCTLLACALVGIRFDKKDVVRYDKSSALDRLAGRLWEQSQQTLWACDGDDLHRDRTGVGLSAWNLLDATCRILELAPPYISSSESTIGRNLDMCRNAYSRVKSSEQNNPSVSLAPLRKVLHFTVVAASVSRPALGARQFWEEGHSCSPENFDWLVDYLAYVSRPNAEDHEMAGDVLWLLCSRGVSCSPTKRQLFIERLIFCMGSNMPHRVRHAALRAAHSAREVMASIDTIDDERLQNMVFTNFSPAVMSAVCPRPGATLANDDPDCFFDQHRDSCYLELIFALATNSNWYPHLIADGHVDRCISMIAECCQNRHPAIWLAGILLRIAPEQLSIPSESFNSITEKQWWDLTSTAWFSVYHLLNDHMFRCELLPVLVEGTKKYMKIASKSDLKVLISRVKDILPMLEMESEYGDGVVVAVKELMTVASDMLRRFS